MSLFWIVVGEAEAPEAAANAKGRIWVRLSIVTTRKTALIDWSIARGKTSKSENSQMKDKWALKSSFFLWEGLFISL